MKFSEKWLREWVNPPVGSEELVQQLTLLGLEVDDAHSATLNIDDVIVARVESVVAHPDADRLRVCQVDNGTSDLLQVVCGADNVRVGLITALATVGGALPDGSRIKKARLRGVESHGMLCSGSELGLSEQHDGLIELPSVAPVGEQLSAYLDLDDQIIDVDLTPDRGDCLSIRGIARDLCARNNVPMQLHEITEVAAQHEDVWPVQVSSASACVCYVGRVVKEVDMTADSPVWMTERLRRSGVRSINPAVDVTNYVMLELGQPMHAFDLDKVQGAIQVRLAGEGELLTLLDGREVSLQSGTTIIADDSGAIGIAGIMGGASTAVDQNTRRLFLESALFLPEQIIGKPQHYATLTESSHRFERGVDPQLQTEAMQYATGMLMTLAGGKPGPARCWQDKPRLPHGTVVKLRSSRLQRILGVQLPADVVERILSGLGIDFESEDNGWLVTPPSYRYDLRIEEDFIEEVGRVYGYDLLPRTSPAHQPLMRAVPESSVPTIDIKLQLAHCGFQEVITYSFVDAKRQGLLRPDLAALALTNPISSDMSVMRTTLLGGLLDTMQRNQSRQMLSMKLFETGLRFLPVADAVSLSELDVHIAAEHGKDTQIDKTLQQQNMLAGLVVGHERPENWHTATRDADFFDLKADLEALFRRADGVSMHFGLCELESLHPGQRATVFCDGVGVGVIGRLHPEVQKMLDLSQSPVVFELSLAALANARVPHVNVVSRYPSVRRDIALLVDETVTHDALLECVREHAPEWLQEVTTFDLYRGDKVANGKKSIALGLIMQDFSRTLEEVEVEQAVALIVQSTTTELGAVLRV